jgi:hypothetical protein
MPIPAKKVAQYLQLKRFTEADGNPSEQANAKRLMATWRQKWPGIHKAAELLHRQQVAEAEARARQEEQRQQQSRQGRPNWRTADPSPPPSTPPWRRKGWGEVLRGFQEAMDKATRSAEVFADRVAQAQAGRDLIEYVELTTRFTPADNLVISMKMPTGVYEMAQDMNPVQRQAFRQELHRMLDTRLEELFGEG